MKRIYLLLAAFLCLTSCSDLEDWLDVKPKTQSTRDDLLSDAQGFEDALTGVYMQMIESSAYGSNLSFNLIDNMAGLYTPNGNTSLQYKVKHHQWTDSGVEASINGVFNKLYKIISGCNSILSKLDENPGVVRDTVLENCIYGEALGIRAMCHLDVLRLFGPVPSEKNDDRILSYVTTFGHDITPASTFDEYVGKLRQDMKEAETKLQYDPIYSGNTISNSYLQNRQYRMNYFAVKGLEAIAELYLGNNDAAFAAATAVINATSVASTDNALIYTLGTSSCFLNNDLFFNSEHVFALYDFSLGDTYQNSFSNGSLNVGLTLEPISSSIYGSSAVDMRAPNLGDWWTIVTTGDNSYAICQKYKTESDHSTGYGHRIPLIRLAEMYLIAVETAPTIAEAQTYWDTFETSRNVEPIALTEQNMETTLQSEYLKEFFAEGKMFYFYKRHNTDYTKWWNMERGISIDYVLPLPEAEITYRQ